jgi:acetoin utilization protein AcuB
MKHVPQAVAAMTPFPYAVDHDARVGEALALLAEHRFHHLPVTERGRVSGIVTDQDLATIPPQWRVRHVVKPAYVIEAGEPLDRVLREMIEHHHGAAIVTKHGKLAGVFTCTDALRLLLKMLHERFGPPPPGQEAA